MPYSSASVVACSGCWDWRQPIPHEAFAERCEVPEGTRPISSFFGIAGRSRNLPCIQIVSLFDFTCLFCLTRKFLYLLCKEGSWNDVVPKPAITSETCPTGGGPRFSADLFTLILRARYINYKTMIRLLSTTYNGPAYVSDGGAGPRPCRHTTRGTRRPRRVKSTPAVTAPQNQLRSNSIEA